MVRDYIGARGPYLRAVLEPRIQDPDCNRHCGIEFDIEQRVQFEAVERAADLSVRPIEVGDAGQPDRYALRIVPTGLDGRELCEEFSVHVEELGLKTAG